MVYDSEGKLSMPDDQEIERMKVPHTLWVSIDKQEQL